VLGIHVMGAVDLQDERRPVRQAPLRVDIAPPALTVQADALADGPLDPVPAAQGSEVDLAHGLGPTGDVSEG
jgi:hypothetical protein